MSDALIREYVAEDVPELIRLWTSVFDDTASMVEKFITALPDIGGGVAALIDGKIAGAAYTINGQELICGDKHTPIGYIYGVGVLEKYRHCGIGEKLVKAVCELSRKRGADIISCLPAEGGLYAWYEKIADFGYTVKCEKLTVKAAASAAVTRLSATEYMTRREKMLEGKTHVRLSRSAMEFEGQLLEEYGGGFFASEDGLCAAYNDGGKTLAREVIAGGRNASIRAAESVGAALGTSECELRLPATNGGLYVASDKPLPDGCIWNLTFD